MWRYPRSARRCDASGADLHWVINAYLLPLSALLLLGGAAGDRYGRVRMLVAGTALFAAASLACALAPSLSCCWPAAGCRAWAPRS